MSCQPAGLAARSHLTNLKTLKLASLNYHEPQPGGHHLFEGNERRLEQRVWDMIKARKAGKPLPETWLAADPEVVAAARARRAVALERRAKAIEKKIADLQAELERIRKDARELREAK